MINQLHLAMIELYKGDAKRIQHFCKVHSYAKLIAETENVDKNCQFIIEAAALTHDIGIHMEAAMENYKKKKVRQLQKSCLENWALIAMYPNGFSI